MKNLRKLTLLCGLLTAVSLSVCAMPTTTTTLSQGEVKISGQPVASARINEALAHYTSEARQNGEKIQAEAQSTPERSWPYEHNYTQKATYCGDQYISFLTEEYTKAVRTATPKRADSCSPRRRARKSRWNNISAAPARSCGRCWEMWSATIWTRAM